MDRIYTIIGLPHADQRRNIIEILLSGMHRIAETLGGHDAAEKFLADFLAYMDRADTCSYKLLWVVRATAPQ